VQSSVLLALGDRRRKSILEILQIVLTLAFDIVDMGWICGIAHLDVGMPGLFISRVLVIIGGIKAYGGQWYKLPIIGEFAWKTVNK
jgi:uncharacterized membrane protein